MVESGVARCRAGGDSGSREPDDGAARGRGVVTAVVEVMVLFVVE